MVCGCTGLSESGDLKGVIDGKSWKFVGKKMFKECISPRRDDQTNETSLS
jgi:hypothetical protein